MQFEVELFFGNNFEYKQVLNCKGQSVDNMRTIISVLFVSIFAGSYAFYSDHAHFKNADKDILSKQAVLLELLQHPYQPGVSVYKPQYLDIVHSFNFENSYDKFQNTDAIKQFYHMYKHGLMPFNELFSIYNKKHRQQAIALFHVFYYAKGKCFSNVNLTN